MSLFSALFAAGTLGMLYATWQAILALRAVGEQISSAKPATVQVDLHERNPAPVMEDPRIEGLEAKIDNLTLAVAEGIQRVHRSENRVRAVIASARRELADQGFEHAGVEAEARELRELDGKPSDDEPVPAVPDDVGNGTQAPSAIPGVTVGELAAAWRLRR